MGDRSEKEDCANVAKTLTCARFQISVLRSQVDKQQQRSFQIQELLDQARGASSSNVADVKTAGLFGNIFGHQESGGESPKSPQVTMTRAEIDKMKQEKASVDAVGTEANKKIGRLETSLAEAKRTVKKFMDDTVHAVNEERLVMKHAIRQTALEVDPKGAECAQTLGRLMLRTPHFFVANGIIGMPTAESAEPRKKHGKRDAIDLSASESWAVYEEIDHLVEMAALQEETAIEKLLAMLIDPRLQIQLRHHLHASVAEKAAFLDRHDKERISETGHRAAMCALWPASPSAPNYKAYEPIMMKMQNQQAIEYDDEGRNSSWNNSQGTPAQPQKNSLARPRRRMSDSRDPARPLEKSLKTLDTQFAELLQKDKNLHLTPLVIEAMIKLASFGMERYHHEEVILFGCPDLPEVHWEEPHWFLRRKAALKICEMAAEGHRYACELICTKLLRDKEHWLVRSIVAEEVCRMLGHLSAENPFFRDFLDELTRVLLTMPVVSTKISRQMQKAQFHQKAISNVQRSAERTLGKELPTFSLETRTIVIQDMLSKCPAREGDAKRQVVERILRVIGGAPPRVVMPS